jgi:hypothetical protein
MFGPVQPMNPADSESASNNNDDIRTAVIPGIEGMIALS